MANRSNKLSREPMIWCADNSHSIDLTIFYSGKSTPVTRNDRHYPFIGQPNLMASLTPALEAYAYKIGKAQLTFLKTYLSSLFVLLTEKYPGGNARLDDISENLLHAHAVRLRTLGLSPSARSSLHSIGNKIVAHSHARYHDIYPNLSNHGKPIRYPRVPKGTSARTLKDTPIDLEPYVKRYCLQILRDIDRNPFRNVTPSYGTDLMNPAHVMYDYMRHIEKKLRGNSGTPWQHQKKISFPWKRAPAITKMTKEAEQLGRTLGELWCGNWVRQMREALYPTPNEIIASVLLVTLEVGWVDTAKAFRLDSTWYTTIAKDPQNPTSREYVTLTPQIRPKLRREVYTKASSPRKGGSWWAIKRLETRSKRLREFCQTRDDELSKALKLTPTSENAWEKIRLEREHWRELKDLAFIYVYDDGAGSALSLKGQLYSHFLQTLPDRADFQIPPDIQTAMRKATHYDFRHISAERTLRRDGLLATQRSLDHKHLTTTLNYLRSRQLKHDLFDIYARVSGIAYDEIERRAVLNKGIIRKRYIRNGANLTTEERRALGGLTLHGARCKDPLKPPKEVDSSQRDLCIEGSCIRCPLAVWNWYDRYAISLAVTEYLRTKTAATLETSPLDEADCIAWEALFSEVPEDLQEKLHAELKRAQNEKGVKEK